LSQKRRIPFQNGVLVHLVSAQFGELLLELADPPGMHMKDIGIVQLYYLAIYEKSGILGSPSHCR